MITVVTTRPSLRAAVQSAARDLPAGRHRSAARPLMLSTFPQSDEELAALPPHCLQHLLVDLDTLIGPTIVTSVDRWLTRYPSVPVTLVAGTQRLLTDTGRLRAFERLVKLPHCRLMLEEQLTASELWAHSAVNMLDTLADQIANDVAALFRRHDSLQPLPSEVLRLARVAHLGADVEGLAESCLKVPVRHLRTVCRSRSLPPPKTVLSILRTLWCAALLERGYSTQEVAVMMHCSSIKQLRRTIGRAHALDFTDVKILGYRGVLELTLVALVCRPQRSTMDRMRRVLPSQAGVLTPFLPSAAAAAAMLLHMQ